MGIHEPGAGAGDPAEFDRIGAADAQIARTTPTWAGIAPNTAEKPAGFDARNPADPNYDWKALDAFVRAADQRGIAPLLTTYWAPPWAEGDDAADRANRFGFAGTYRVNAKELGDYMHAMATRYSGSFKDASGTTLPRVKFFQIWNEPNFSQYLVSRKKADIPLIYAHMLSAAYDEVKAVSKSNLVLTGGLGPFGNNGAATDVEPQFFMRSLLCLTGRGGERLKDNKNCKYPRAKFDVWTQHPYTFGGTPTTKAGNPDSAALGNMPAVRKTLDYAVKVRNIAGSGRKRLWVTEFAWLANPPGLVTGDGRQIGLSPSKHAAYLSETAYRLWKLRFEALIWYGLHDQTLNEFPSGLFQGKTMDAAAPRPALDAFKFPFFADAGSRGVLFWGLANGSGRSTVRIERQSGSSFKRVAAVRTDSQGMLYTRLKGKKATYRARVVAGSKNGLTSQTFKSR
jgi:hypothetical protein